ncbi:ferredoxin [Streptomyces sp. NPDC056405]|uniref:ferredoxin n=1 Tax=Streptomyces sp. NPDC056405 TaxID=3345811 RepID=UPI0035DB08B3
MRLDNRLTDGAPMRPLACERCAAEVLVRKSSWQQTSVQWNARATAACAERDAADGADGAFEGCRSLRETIREAALRGTVEVVDGGDGGDGGERPTGAAGRAPARRG